MSRQAKGSFETRVLADESCSSHLRYQRERKRDTLVLHERRGCPCPCGCGGGWEEAEAREEMRELVAWARVGLRPARRPSRGPRGRAEGSARVPTFAEYAAWWLEAKIAGVLGDQPISENTAIDYRTRLGHLAYLGAYRVDQIDAGLCLELKAHLLWQARAVREALEAGVDLRERSGRRRRPLGPATIRKVLGALRSILEDAVEDGLLARNPAQGRRMRVAVPKPKRSYLEIDELAFLLDAAGDQDDPFAGVEPSPSGRSATAVARLTARGLRPRQVVERLGLSRATVTHHLRRLGADVKRRGRIAPGRPLEGSAQVRRLLIDQVVPVRLGQHLVGPGRVALAVRSRAQAGFRTTPTRPSTASSAERHPRGRNIRVVP